MCKKIFADRRTQKPFFRATPYQKLQSLFIYFFDILKEKTVMLGAYFLGLAAGRFSVPVPCPEREKEKPSRPSSFNIQSTRPPVLLD